MNLLTWVRLAVGAAVLAALGWCGWQLREHWVDLGSAQVQAKWDAQKKTDAEDAAKLAHERDVEQLAQFRNAERTADEDQRREKDRTDRLAAALGTVAGLRNAIAKLDSDDLSAAAADPRVAAIARRAAAAREQLGRCADRYTAVAERADRFRDQAAGLRDFALNVCHAGGPALDSTKAGR